jgi:hypothetical protein
MMRPAVVGSLALALSLPLLSAGQARGEEMAPEYRKAVDKGLAWVAKNQAADGHWDANGGHYPVTMTSLGGMVLLMEGSTIRDGKYSDKIRKATDWLMDRSQRNGMIGNPNNPTEAGRYMYGHGFALLFLSQVYGEEEDGERRRKLETILTKAVEFTGKAQTNRGGWGYVSAADGGGFDEGSVTITQVQALRAARNAGIRVPKGIVDKAHEYLKNCTTQRGGVIYSLAHGGRAQVGGERPPLTAAAVACMFSAGEYNSPLAKQWLGFCRDNIPLGGGVGGGGRFGHDEYTHYYYAQALYILGDKGYEKLFPEAKGERALSWSKYRKTMFDHIVRMQNADGSWTGGGIGTIYSSAIYLTILQLDNGTLPIYQR